ncbi:aspartate aminotransferase family protein [Sulfitobacter mediterraneus]|uniref:pyridoxal phosphate-dependent decarboxylase family protein n=1 Tax=Sulfitobacter mediterraneus TaxID=83219 RepID=UPI001933DE40|nr:pyridoxal-dependent decarboxylase [Sulfitobacter mediterraneus]MBM1634586.1 aspartate aminotransferase family protein [Sulfitobacter mediterraneus]MBM1642404.1 aspartate aminotransferase family protein [Sulfitobacter mediterraneus]MBM1646452.1 aspartate aminotransferase family protein [Sulfitobacter mediterraneus]MBM1650498.1 aspartate aminotransferase family protein [Sulfitobacter mediterraneus]MBM1654520.1 aspartate aminotransferase family protein [Sulfitobacter mediterraneus]
MDWDEFAHWGKHISDWSADYHKTLRDRPVRAQTAFGETAAQLPQAPPDGAEAMDRIMADFEQIVMPGITHWQHPRFFAYFPANAAPPSMLAEMLVTTIASQCMLWQTSPAATEVETVMVQWLRQALGLSEGFTGVIQDSASSATLSAVLTMRERATGYTGNRDGIAGKGHLRIYCSDQVHSSIDRACWVSGIGQANLVKIPATGPRHGMDAAALQAAITADRAAGHTPAGIIAITGGTGIGACDTLGPILEIARTEDLYTHLDAAWAGAAMICPELQAEFWADVNGFDSIVFNPHKWLGAQFDCSVQFLRDAQPQLNTLKIEPEYLKTTGESVTNYSEWTIPLGRRFRALKIWFLIRSYGLDGLRSRIRNHILWAGEVCEAIRKLDGFEIVTEPILSLFSFRCPGSDEDQQHLVDALNDDGRIYVTQGSFQGRKIIRFQVGQFDTTRADVMMAETVIRDIWGKMQ